MNLLPATSKLKRIMFIMLFLFMIGLINLFTGIGIYTVNEYNNYFDKPYIHRMDNPSPNFDFDKKMAVWHKITYFGIFKKPFCLGWNCGDTKIDIWLTLRKKDVPVSKKCEIKYNEEENVWYEITCFDNNGLKVFYSQFYIDNPVDLHKYNMPIPTKENPTIEIIPEN